MELDTRTITMIGMASALLFAVLGVLVGSGRRSCPGFHYWTAANLTGAAAQLIIGLRGIIPESFSVVFGNLCAIVAASLVIEGIRRFRGQTGLWWPSPVFGAATLACVIYYRFGVDDLNTRITIMSVYLGVFSMVGAKEFFSMVRPGYRLSMGFTAVILAASAAGHFIRLGMARTQPPVAALFAPSGTYAFLMTLTVLGIIAWSFGFFMINHDFLVEHLKNAEARATRAVKTKGDFLANASHEIRTPLNGVIGLTELLLDSPLDAVQRDYAETVHESGIALLAIINDLLDLSKIEAGKIEILEEPFDPREVVEKTVAVLAWKAKNKGLNFEWEVDRNVPDRLLGDPGRLRQVLTNLAGNSIKFTSAGEVSIRVSYEGSALCFSVTDTGPGIAKGDQKRLFERFEQMENGRHNGTGLGLAISKDLAQRMGGKIGVISEYGHGSTFWFTATPKKVMLSDPNPVELRRA
jgi:signal transduction histidine kinase